MASQQKTNSTPTQPGQGGADRPGQRPNETQDPGQSQSKGEPEKHQRQGQGANKTPQRQS